MARGHTDLGVVPKECRPSRSSLLSGVGRAWRARERQTLPTERPPTTRCARRATTRVYGPFQSPSPLREGMRRRYYLLYGT